MARTLVLAIIALAAAPFAPHVSGASDPLDDLTSPLVAAFGFASTGGVPTPFATPGITCDPMSWSGSIATLTCRSALIGVWVCQAPSVAATVTGVATVRAASTCGGTVTCTASANGVVPGYTPACFATAGLTQPTTADFTCAAEVTGLVASSWSAVCSFPLV